MDQGTPVTLNSLETFISSAVGVFFRLAAVAVVGALAYAGFLMVTAGNNTQRFEQGKKMLQQVVIGAAVIFGIGIIVNTIAHFAMNPTGVIR